ncbi:MULTISPECIES: TnsA endonuclease N-terminal domain-containing protein [Geobacillus]|uniref:TnsA endonuclease N-terminal domain-containing protein n=1 Tax=Geobacillus TaxID=129337 RepID=UPI00168160B8|nr:MULTISPECIES: TnsA endonuclease N-terminal domain-containing protein [Geobacillus]MED4869801.1 TnsA endonuclease N-terminal domain-containing protein [Geobacillus stearothermophilus]MED4987197.1 TnsA endonuclease N-terminal domain-containing protein [Geobacillus stearothermophilus]QNU19911.1 TnsA endonuclease N-terminal domain-containing protein [Geobacillus thermoleovorans]
MDFQVWKHPKVQRLIKEGRGQGRGKDYIPWTKTHEFSSKGRATRVLGLKTGRIHHLHSDNQYRAFLIFEWSDRVIDIRETFPLLDVMKMIDTKEDLRFDKFCDRKTKEPLVITTSFVLTVRDEKGNEYDVARAVKNATELEKRITFEKLEIERRYWEAKKIDWKVITDKQLPRQLAKNIEWVRETVIQGNQGDLDVERLSYELLVYLLQYMDVPLKDVLKVFEKEGMLPKGTGLFLFRYLIAKKHIRVDMLQKVDVSKKVEDVIDCEWGDWVDHQGKHAFSLERQ